MLNDNFTRSHVARLGRVRRVCTNTASVRCSTRCRNVGLARAGQLSRGEGFRDMENVGGGAGQADERCPRQLRYGTNAAIGLVLLVLAENGAGQGYGPLLRENHADSYR